MLLNARGFLTTNYAAYSDLNFVTVGAVAFAQTALRAIMNSAILRGFRNTNWIVTGSSWKNVRGLFYCGDELGLVAGCEECSPPQIRWQTDALTLLLVPSTRNFDVRVHNKNQMSLVKILQIAEVINEVMKKQYCKT